MKNTIIALVVGIAIGAGGFFATTALTGCPCGPQCACAPCDCSK